MAVAELQAPVAPAPACAAKPSAADGGAWADGTADAASLLDAVRAIAQGDLAAQADAVDRGQYPRNVMHALGVSAIVSPAFGRQFFRNAINNVMPVIECDIAGMAEGDEVEVLRIADV